MTDNIRDLKAILIDRVPSQQKYIDQQGEQKDQRRVNNPTKKSVTDTIQVRTPIITYAIRTYLPLTATIRHSVCMYEA